MPERPSGFLQTVGPLQDAAAQAEMAGVQYAQQAVEQEKQRAHQAGEAAKSREWEAGQMRLRQLFEQAQAEEQRQFEAPGMVSEIANRSPSTLGSFYSPTDAPMVEQGQREQMLGPGGAGPMPQGYEPPQSYSQEQINAERRDRSRKIQSAGGVTPQGVPRVSAPFAYSVTKPGEAQEVKPRKPDYTLLLEEGRNRRAAEAEAGRGRRAARSAGDRDKDRVLGYTKYLMDRFDARGRQTWSEFARIVDADVKSVVSGWNGRPLQPGEMDRIRDAAASAVLKKSVRPGDGLYDVLSAAGPGLSALKPDDLLNGRSPLDVAGEVVNNVAALEPQGPQRGASGAPLAPLPFPVAKQQAKLIGGIRSDEEWAALPAETKDLLLDQAQLGARNAQMTPPPQ